MDTDSSMRTTSPLKKKGSSSMLSPKMMENPQKRTWTTSPATKEKRAFLRSIANKESNVSISEG
jgi:hypothetical protein